jgi:hypothetical protein
MKSWKTPTLDEVEKAIAWLGHGQHNRYFFERLENPEWIRPLKAKGFFSLPPEPVRDTSRGTIAFPPWPESRYLARMTKNLPDTVLEVALAIPRTENVRVHDDLADVALALPAASAAKLVSTAKTWIEAAYQLLLPEKLGNLVCHLALGGEVDAALGLSRSLLEVLPDPKPILVPEPRARFASWDYAAIVRKHVPELVRVSGLPALALLCDLLDDAVRLSQQHDDGEDSEDYSYIWRPAIDQPRPSEGIRGILVSAVRDAAKDLIIRNLATIAQVIEALEERRWQAFHRIGLYVLHSLGDRSPDLVADRLRQPARFDRQGIRLEYGLLAKQWFGRIKPADKTTILDWIEQGPDIEAFRIWWPQFAERAVTDEDAVRYRKKWQRDRLAMISDGLESDWKLRYEQLVKELGPPEDLLEVHQSTASWFVPSSPKTSADLSGMNVPDIVEYLKSWQPSGEMMAASIAGLAQVLATAVGTAVERFAAQAEFFKGSDPTYIRELLNAFNDSARQRKSFDWENPLILCRWVTEQPVEIGDRRGGLNDRDPDWGWTRSTIVRLLSSGFDNSAIPFALRIKAWEVLEPLTEDPNPTPRDEERHLEEGSFDPSSLSINSTRGLAIDCVVRYALWARQEIQAGDNSKEGLYRGFEQMPEVEKVLEQHLDPTIDPSLAIRSVYARWLPWLHLLDREWLEKNLSKVFPPDETMGRCAWTAYITHCDVYDPAFDLLKTEYSFAVDRIGKFADESSGFENPDARLAYHLMVLYWRGKLSLTDENGLLQRFFVSATDELRGYALAFIGKSLTNETKQVPSGILEKSKALWAARLTVARTADDPKLHVEEMASFGWWFASNKFDDEWAMRQQIEALKVTKRTEPEHLVVERLVELSRTMPSEAVECLALIIEGDEKGWGILGWEDNAKLILTEGINSVNQTARSMAIDLIHKLGSRGYFGYKELLPR